MADQVETTPAEEGSEVMEPILPARKSTARKQDKTTMGLLVIAAFVAVAGIAFAGGRLSAGSTTGSGANPGASLGFGGRGINFRSLAPGQTLNPGQFGNGNPGGRNGGSTTGSLTGVVQSVSDTSMTILLANGQSVTVTLSSTTKYSIEASASPGAVSVGSTVIVQIDTAAAASATPMPGASGQLSAPVPAKAVIVAD